MIVLLILSLLFPPAPPQVAWVSPGELQITAEPGQVLWYQRPNYPAVSLPCEQRCVLRTGGDYLYYPEAGASAWSQSKTGDLSPVVVVPDEPLWYTYYFPLMAMGP